MEQPGVLAGPITRRSCGSNPTPAIFYLRTIISPEYFNRFNSPSFLLTNVFYA